MRLDRVGENGRLKAGNLKKVLTGIQDYNADVLGIKFNQSFTLPDIQAAAQGDKQHLSKCSLNKKPLQSWPLYLHSILSRMVETTTGYSFIRMAWNPEGHDPAKAVKTEQFYLKFELYRNWWFFWKKRIIF